MIQSINLYSRLSRQRLTYALLFLAALLGEVDLLFTAGVVLSLVGEAAFDLVAALAGVDFDGMARGLLAGLFWAVVNGTGDFEVSYKI